MANVGLIIGGGQEILRWPPLLFCIIFQPLTITCFPHSKREKCVLPIAPAFKRESGSNRTGSRPLTGGQSTEARTFRFEAALSCSASFEASTIYFHQKECRSILHSLWVVSKRLSRARGGGGV
jgi:hypothetical protein